MGILKIQNDNFDEQDLLDLYEHAPCGYVSLSLDGVILKVNQTFCQFLQKEKDQLEKILRFQDLLTSPSRAIFERQMFDQGMTLELRSSFGKIHFFKVSCKKVKEVLRLTLVDISEQKKWYEKLKTTSRFGLKVSESLDYKTTIDNITEMICAQLADGCLIDVFRNQNLHRVGEGHYNPDKKIVMMALLKGKLVIDAVIENKEVILNDLNDSSIDPIYKDEIEILKKFGIQSLVIIPLVLSGRKIGAISFVNTDYNKIFHEDRITLLRGLCTHISSALDRSRLHETVAIEAKNRYDLIALASHKIRTPLTSLKLQLQASLKKISASEASAIKRAEVERFMSRLTVYMNNISEHVDNMIDLNEINQKFVLYKERVNLRELVFEVERSLIPAFEEAHCEVHLWVETDIWTMLDPERIKKIINHIFVNSMKYGRGRPVQITLNRIKGFALLQVKDFGQRKTDGLGSIESESLRLDMRLSLTIIEEHGGSMESEVDKDGAHTLSVYLPV